MIFNKVPKGVEISLSGDDREFLEEKIEMEGEDYLLTDQSFYDLWEDKEDGDWELIAPEEIGALTSSIIISDELIRDDNGEIESIGDVYWLPNYAIESPVEMMFNLGKVFFSKG